MRLTMPLRPKLFEPVEEPIRAELFGIERLEQHAESLAAAQVVERGWKRSRLLMPRVEDNGRVLRDANRAIADAVREDRWITPAAEWLVDNFFVVDEQLREIRDDLPPEFYRELPKLADGPLAGYPRVYGIAWAFVAHTDSRFDPETLRRFLTAYQRVQPLTIGELWAVAISLRVVLVENLRRLADWLVRQRAARQEADALADQLLGLTNHGGNDGAPRLRRNERGPFFPAFAAELVQRLRDYDPAVTPALGWLQQRLAAQGTTPDEIALVEHQRQAAMTVTVRNIITSMRLLSALDWSAFFESVSLVDEALRAGSSFAAMDFASRDSYRHAIEHLARGSRRPELDVVRAALDRAARARTQPSPVSDERQGDPGYYLIGRGRRGFERSLGFRRDFRLGMLRFILAGATPGYLGTLAVLTALILAVPLDLALAAGLNTSGLIVLGLLALIPASDFAIVLLNRGVAAVVPPCIPPRLELRDGVPAEFRTMVVVPTLLTGRAEVDEQIERLEVHYLANADGDVRFALLSDWPDAPTEHAPGDDDILAAAVEGIARLNTRHGPTPDGGDRFLLYHRRRLWNASQGVWMGWERKRGKLHEFNRLLRGATDTTFLRGDAASGVPGGVRYVVTLDADTRLPIGAVKRLVGTSAHPLNRPRIDAATQRVVEGYAVLQPRVTPPLPGRSGSLFQRLSSASAGIDPYAAAVSDVYQDLFGEGSYTGKGIYDVDAFEAALEGRVPENALLSHDLFEGLFARACLVTDIEFFEAAPAHYLASTARQHRWTRGDWQLLLWILYGRIPVIGRWKMVDNLRRTLSMPCAFLTLVAGWVWPGSSPLLWTAFVLGTISIPGFVPLFTGAAPRRPGVSKRSHLRALGRDLRFAVYQAALMITMIAHQAWLMSDAIVRTLGRIFVSHRALLEWTPAADAMSRAPRNVLGLYDRMAGGVILAMATALAVAVWRPAAWPVALPLLILWGLSPAIAQWVSRPGAAVRAVPLNPEEARALRLIARRTWRFFATFVTPESGSLPPDNFQETPHPVVAQRTSPTNIGLYLLSVVTARDSGWVSALDAVGRIEATQRAMDGLEHYRGHLYNWYATRDGRPLEPRYVSSVDSGNLAGALVALGNACREMIAQPVIGTAALDGIADAALLVRDAAHGPDGARAGLSARRRLDDAIEVVLTLAARRPETPADWAERLSELELAARTAAHCARDVGDTVAADPPSSVLVWAEALRATVETHLRDLDTLMPWARVRIDPAIGPLMAPLATPPSPAEMRVRCEAVIQDLVALRATLVDSADAASASLQGKIDTLINGLERSTAAGDALIRRLTTLADSARSSVAKTDFGFLFDPTRLLFAIGYRMSDGRLDPGRYDLLASEARLLSFLAIAKGDVPVKHWFRLGRALTPVGKDSALLSWSGSMFEYLMPALVMQTPVGSLLEQTCRLAVHRQIDYGASRGVPWGVSESGYAARDFEMTYQYSNFGVPGLGFRRGLADDIVVAPYATALAAMVEPAEALRNFRDLARAGADGQYGFYEALDYTESRLPAESRSVVVRMYMAHHQAMSIVAIANALNRGAMRARFHAEPAVRATELLLQERTPRDVAVARQRVASVTAVRDVREPVLPHARRFTSAQGATPRTHLLSNGRYAVMITAAGSGFSRWRDLAVTRWREDPTCDNHGSYIFVRDVASDDCWSAGFQPSGAEAESYEVSFSEDRAEFLRRDGAITTRLEVIVSSEDDAEVRRVSLTNHGTRSREIEVTSYAEIVLAPAAADAAHPAFSNLFVQTERVPERDTLLAARRPRSAEETPVWLAHVLAVEGEPIGDLEWETDRARFLGRGRGVRSPQAMDGRALSNTVGSVLDPIVSLRRRVRIRPGRTAYVAFATLVAGSRDDVLNLADKYHDVTTFERAATLAWTQAQVQQHHLGISPDEAHLFQTIAGSILYSDRTLRSPSDVIARQAEGPSALWVHGISGDLPLVLVQIDDAEDIGIVRQLLRAHEYWRMKRLAVDLVILNERAPSYMQDLQTLLETLVRTSQAIPAGDGVELHGKVFILRAELVTPAQRDALLSVARVALSSRRGTLAEQIARADRADAAPSPPMRRALAVTPRGPRGDAPHPELEFYNGLGGFDANAREYRIALVLGRRTPAPWINVLANPDFGCLISESGGGCTWSINSRENQLTPWSNDPVSDPAGEVFYVRDEASGEIWSPTPLPIREEHGEYVARHGQGYTRFEYDAHDVALELLQFVPANDPVKISRLTLTNHSSRARRLSVTAYLEWVLGVSRGGSAPFVITEIDPATGAMFARNPWRRDFSTRIAFADLGGAQTAWTADRSEFLGRNGTHDQPAALVRRERLSGRSGTALDPCCAMQTTIEIPARGRAAVVFALGEAATREDARALIQRYRTEKLDTHLKAVTDGWDRILGMVQVTTPDRALNLMLNQWMLYQTLASRMWARTAFYQASGAFGFRDQLQDVMALAVALPAVARNQLLKAASHQFVEGDVQHWWHEPAGRGVRTRISDDLLWLPYVASHYLAVTADAAILEQPVPFLQGPALAPGESESYFEPRTAELTGTLFEHGARAIDRSLAVGAHGLPLMGTGDWNDGMNRVGAEGKGESVWLAWFLHAVLEQWAPLAQARGESARAATWSAHAAALRQAVEREAWDGSWYRRAFFDDGTPLGSVANDECAIDSIVQSWSVISGAGDPGRARLAMASLEERLVRPNDGLILLLAPPFDKTPREPGYIKGYVPGVRENGGQYTHAAAWAAIAFAALGDGDKTAQLLAMLNPISHGATPSAVRQYKVEPYVVAADVYSESPHTGRGGWTWYTGSSGWLYRAGIEWLLGFRKKGERLELEPCIPRSWPGFSIAFRHCSTRYDIVVENPQGVCRGVALLELDGVKQSDRTGIAIVDDEKTHRVRVVLG